MTKQQKFDLIYLRMAHVVAGMSKDPSTKVGAVIVADRKVSTGYNGYPRGADDSTMDNREEKYKRVIHAELNAILNCPFDCSGATLYCSLRPCSTCLGAIINAGITRVVHYGPAWTREPHPEVSDEFAELIVIDRYDNDVVVEALKGIE